VSASRIEAESAAAARPPGAPEFRSALLDRGPAGGALRPRRLMHDLTLSIAAHVMGAFALIALSLFSVEAIPAPPIIIRFLAAAPPPPRLVPPRPALKPPPEPRPVPVRIPVVAPAPLLVPPPAPPPRRHAEPPLKVEAASPPPRAADAGPQPRVLDAAPPPARGGAPSLGTLAAAPTLPSGSGEEPDLVFRVAGKARPRGPGGGLAGAGDGLPALGSADERTGGGRRPRTGDAPGGDLGTEASFAGGGLAAFFGRRYGAPLVDAARLGQRTSDGARYNLLVPMLSEAYRQVVFRGAWRAGGAEESGVDSAQVDRDAIAIRYHDGTLHVVVPTRDGLVALYVSAVGRDPGARTKVDEAERALGALRRLALVRS